MTLVHSPSAHTQPVAEMPVVSGQAHGADQWGAAVLRLIGEKEEMRERAVRAEVLLERAASFIDWIGRDLHHRRCADWYPEGAHSAAEQMSEDMRLLGNACADFEPSPLGTPEGVNQKDTPA